MIWAEEVDEEKNKQSMHLQHKYIRRGCGWKIILNNSFFHVRRAKNITRLRFVRSKEWEKKRIQVCKKKQVLLLILFFPLKNVFFHQYYCLLWPVHWNEVGLSKGHVVICKGRSCHYYYYDSLREKRRRTLRDFGLTSINRLQLNLILDICTFLDHKKECHFCKDKNFEKWTSKSNLFSSQTKKKKERKNKNWRILLSQSWVNFTIILWAAFTPIELCWYFERCRAYSSGSQPRSRGTLGQCFPNPAPRTTSD